MILILEIYVFLLHVGTTHAIFKGEKMFDLMDIFSQEVRKETFFDFITGQILKIENTVPQKP